MTVPAFQPATADQRTAYQTSVAQTMATLSKLDDHKLEQMSRLTLPEITALKEAVASVFPASNLPGFILDGLARLPGRAIARERVESDVRTLFQGVSLIPQALFGAFVAGPAAVLSAYQKLLALAGKDETAAFPEGTWQFYLEFALREDAARHANETLAFHQRITPGAPEAMLAAAWATAIARLVTGYEDLLGQVWEENVGARHLRAHDEKVAHALQTAWAKQRPYTSVPGVRYGAHRRALYQTLLATHLDQLTPDTRAAWLTDLSASIDTRRAYQRQMSLLFALLPEKYREAKQPIPLWRASLAIVSGGAYYLLPLIAHDAHGRPLMFQAHGVSEPLSPDARGVLHTPAGARVRVERDGAVRLATPPPGGDEPLGFVQATPPHVWREQLQAVLAAHAPAGHVTDLRTGATGGVDLLLTESPRLTQEALRALLDEPTRAELAALRHAPVILHWDAVTRAQPLAGIRRVARGVGDHALTVIRTDASFVFDQSHIFFDGAWGMAIAEILTNEALAAYQELGAPARGPAAASTPQALVLRSTPAFENAARAELHKVVHEVYAESSALEFNRAQLARRSLAQRGVRLTFNDLLVLYRTLHAQTYQPTTDLAADVRTLIARLRGDGSARDLLTQLETLLSGTPDADPVLLIPMDASAVDPKERLFPTTFRNPFADLGVRHRELHTRMRAYAKQSADQAEHSTLDTLRREYLAHLHAFGLLLDAIKGVTMRGEGFNNATIKLLGHLPPALQHILNQIPQKIGVLNEILKGDEVFSNVGRVARGSSLARFCSARDDGATKTLVWGVLTDDRDQVQISLRDFRPHVRALVQRDEVALAQRLAQDYLDEYVKGFNRFMSELGAIAMFQSAR